MMSVRVLLALAAIELASAFVGPSAGLSVVTHGPRVCSENALSGLSMQRLGSVRTEIKPASKSRKAPTNTRIGSIRPAGQPATAAAIKPTNTRLGSIRPVSSKAPTNTRIGSIRPAGVPAVGVKQPTNTRLGSIRPVTETSPASVKTTSPVNNRIGSVRGTGVNTSRTGTARPKQTEARLGTARVSLGGAAAPIGSGSNRRIGTARVDKALAVDAQKPNTGHNEEVFVGIASPRAVAKTPVARVGSSGRTSPELKTAATEVTEETTTATGTRPGTTRV